MAWVGRDGNEIWWDEQGSGEPVLLAMGHAWDARMWWPLMPSLSEHYRVIRFDNRGIGRTRWDRQPFSIGDLADDAFAVLDAAGVERAHVQGMSMGGLTAQEMALRRPERVASLVLGCTGTFDQPRSSRLDTARAAVPFRLAMRLFPSALYGPKAQPPMVAEDLRLMEDANTPFAGRLAQSRATNAYFSRDRLPTVTTPTLVLHGDVDKAVPLERGRELADLIPGAELHILTGAGHNFLVDEGAAGQEAILRFLSAQPVIDA